MTGQKYIQSLHLTRLERLVKVQPITPFDMNGKDSGGKRDGTEMQTISTLSYDDFVFSRPSLARKWSPSTVLPTHISYFFRLSPFIKNLFSLTVFKTDACALREKVIMASEYIPMTRSLWLRRGEQKEVLTARGLAEFLSFILY